MWIYTLLTLMIVNQPVLCQFTWTGALPIEVGFDADQTDPELKKNGCDTTISVITTNYADHLIIGGSTADKKVVTEGRATGCKAAATMMPYVQATGTDGVMKWKKVFSDNGKGTYSDVALITYPIPEDKPEQLEKQFFYVVLKSRTAGNSHIIFAL